MQYYHIIGSGTFVTQWGYNSADLVSSMVYPGGNGGQTGETVSYTYLSRMALDTVNGLAAYVTDTLYNAAGQVELRKLGGTAASPTLKVDTSYFPWDMVNGLGRLKRITSGTPADTDSLQDLVYFTGLDADPTPTYDANGNLLNIYDYKAGGTQTQTFTYDTLDRLLSAAASGGTGGIYSESYTYNSTTGNLASKGGVSYTYDTTHKHAVTQLNGVQKYWYDANGNMTTRIVGSNTYNLSYDAENRLSGVSGATTASFVYDGDGVRVKATAGGVTTAYVGNYFEWTGSTSTMVKYYYAGPTRVAMRVGSNNPKWLLSDHLGSQSIVASYNGLTEEGELRYKAWGETRYTSGTTPTKRQYTGQLTETTIGLHFFNARWYDSALGRWAQPDSIVPVSSQGVQSWDRYAFVNNNPVRYNDPSGHDVGCGGRDASACASRKTFLIATGRDDKISGYKGETMKPYYEYAVEKGYQVYYYDPDNKKYNESRQKYDMADDMAKRINNNFEDEFYMFGYSAGADATILAVAMTEYSDSVRGVALLDPTITATVPGQASNSIQKQADQIAANGIPVFLADTPNDNVIASIPGVVRQQYDYTHQDLATAVDVFMLAIQTLMR